MAPAKAPPCSWSVYCNACEDPIPNEHYHCSICDDGDYDLCPKCVGDKKHCKNDKHWLIKRNVESGIMINSVTERIAPKSKDVKVKIEPEQKMPGAFTEEKKQEAEPKIEELLAPTRTCNCCVKGMLVLLST